MGRALFIVDPQYDFINGALPVPGAEKAMRDLSEFVSKGSWDLKIVTMDQHPWGHCSFADNRGQWPRHCVAYTHGSALWQPLVEKLYETRGPVHLLPKGTRPELDHYSIYEMPGACVDIDALFSRHNIETVDFCGLAGDICVLNTLKDALKCHKDCSFNVLHEFSPSIDGGYALTDFCEDNNLSCAR